MAKSDHHIVELQSLRGFAALTVALFHCVDSFASPHWLARGAAVLNAQAAVVIFFVLSGYVLTRSLVGSEQTFGVVAAFYVRRLFRLYPVIWLASLLGFVFLAACEPLTHNPQLSGAFIVVWDAAGRSLLNRLALSFFALSPHLDPPLWTISVELLGSFLIPFAAYLIARNRRPFWFALALLAIAGFALGPRTHRAILMYQVDFFAGAAIFAIPGWLRTFFYSHGRSLFWAAVLFLAAVPLLYQPDHNDPQLHLLELPAAWLAITSIVYAEKRPAVLAWVPAIWFGDISYSFYLLHFIVVSFLAEAALHALHMSTTGLVFLAGAAVFAVAVPLSYLSYEMIERPAIRLGRRLMSSAISSSALESA